VELFLDRLGEIARSRPPRDSGAVVPGWVQTVLAMLGGVRKRVGGGRRISKQIRDVIYMLGFEVSETTVTRWMRRAPRRPEPTDCWLAFPRNHREAIAAMDFFTVPTLTFSVLYCFLIISHDRRRIVQVNVTRHPTSTWIVQQLHDALRYQSMPKFFLLDHDAQYGLEVPAATAARCVGSGCGNPWRLLGPAAAAENGSIRPGSLPLPDTARSPLPPLRPLAGFPDRGAVAIGDDWQGMLPETPQGSFLKLDLHRLLVDLAF
jgi:hypothetical protein